MEYVPVIPTNTSLYSGEKEDRDVSAEFHQLGKNEPRRDFRAYLNIMRRRKWLIIAPLLIALPSVIIVLLLQKPQYEATATLLLDPGTSKIVNIEDVLQADHSREFYETQFRLITSPVLIERVVDILEAQKENLHSQEQSQIASPKPMNIVGKASRTIQRFIKEKLVGDTYSGTLRPEEIARHDKIVGFQKSLKVEVLPGTRLVEVTISGTDPYLVATQVNTLVDAYLEQNLEKKSEASRKASTWLTKEIPDLKEKLQNAELALQRFLDSRGLTPSDLEGKPNNTPEVAGDPNTAYAEAKARRVELQAQLNEMQKMLQNPVGKRQSSLASLNNPTLTALQQKYVALEGEVANLSQLYKEKHPKMLAVLAEKEQVKNSMEAEIRKNIDSIKMEYNVAATKENSFENSINQKKAESIKLNKYMAEYSALKRDVDTKRALYENLSKRFDETEITKGLQTNNIKVINRADKPIEQKPSRNMTKIFICAVVALSFGVGSCFIAEALEGRFVNIEDAEQYLQLAVLGIIPHQNKKDKNGIHNLIVLQEPYSEMADCYRNLRTNINIQLDNKKSGGVSLLITSAVPGEGKSTTSSNLAISFAQAGKKVLLVDTDLRRPSIHKYFNLINEFGLTDILIEGYTWNEIAHDGPVEGLKILTSGPIPPNPAELLDMQRMHKLHQSIKDAFDLIIYDAPIVISVPDTIVVATAADGVLLIHHPTLGNKEKVAASKKILRRAHANIIGIVFNNVNIRHMHSSDQLYYNSYYHDIGTSSDRVSLLSKPSLHKEDGDVTHPTSAQSSLPMSGSQSGHDNGFSFTIRAALFREEVCGVQAGQGLSFLIVDLELNNMSDTPLNFDSRLALIYMNEQNKYGSALSRIYDMPDKDQYQTNSGNVYHCDTVTSIVENGLWGVEVVSSMTKRNGIVIYKVPKLSKNYTFCYESEDINININI